VPHHELLVIVGQQVRAVHPRARALRRPAGHFYGIAHRENLERHVHAAEVIEAGALDIPCDACTGCIDGFDEDSRVRVAPAHLHELAFDLDALGVVVLGIGVVSIGRLRDESNANERSERKRLGHGSTFLD
jgi:hypothetical protein